MISAWARMCKILGEQFVQYLPVVMKPVLSAASLDILVVFIDGEVVTHMLYNSCTQKVFGHTYTCVLLSRSQWCTECRHTLYEYSWVRTSFHEGVSMYLEILTHYMK